MKYVVIRTDSAGVFAGEILLAGSGDDEIRDRALAAFDFAEHDVPTRAQREQAVVDLQGCAEIREIEVQLDLAAGGRRRAGRKAGEHNCRDDGETVHGPPPSGGCRWGGYCRPLSVTSASTNGYAAINAPAQASPVCRRQSAAQAPFFASERWIAIERAGQGDAPA